MAKVVAGPILIVDSKSNLVHQGQAGQQNYSSLDTCTEPSLLKCNLGEICTGRECWAKFVSFGRPTRIAHQLATTLAITSVALAPGLALSKMKFQALKSA